MFKVEEFNPMAYAVEHGHEQFVFNYDKETGLRALIAVHSTILGPSLGGTRMWHYDTYQEAALDVLRLSEGMTYKAAVAGLPLGGGKAVIMTDGKENDPAIRAARFRAFGRFVESLNGRYITAEDVGTKPGDMLEIMQSTEYVSGRPMDRGGSGDPSPMTAFGVLQGIHAAAESTFGVDSLKGVRVAIQGLGKVGMALAEMLVQEGAHVIGTDIREETMREARERLGITTVIGDEIYSLNADIFAPCALGAIINDETLPKLKCKIIAGAANNQLEDIDRHSIALDELGIVYAVDYVINAGGLINVASELTGYDEEAARAKTANIYHTIHRMLKMAKDEGITTQKASERMAREALESKRSTQETVLS